MDSHPPKECLLTLLISIGQWKRSDISKVIPLDIDAVLFIVRWLI